MRFFSIVIFKYKFSFWVSWVAERAGKLVMVGLVNLNHHTLLLVLTLRLKIGPYGVMCL